jgi:Ca-activated chloride channel family protein
MTQAASISADRISGKRLRRWLVCAAAAWALGACDSSSSTPKSPANPSPSAPSLAPSAERIDLTFTYGSEKEEWIKEVTAAFNADAAKSAVRGKRIRVEAVPMGSGECIDGLVDGTRKAHLTSPASLAFIKLGNARWRARTGKDLIESTENLVLSPVVIAMWKPMAQALGAGTKPVGWAELLTLARSEQGWSGYDKPQWGRFKFGHTHPQFSNSGLISLFAEVYAAAGKTSGLQLSDLEKPEVARYVSDIERSVVHYGSSTGFFGKKMFSNGPEYLSAAVLYENMVIEANSGKYSLQFPLTAVYPKEGTFWSDHPAGIVERDWVTPEHREAARVYLQFLLGRPQQERALSFGFRPASPEIPLADPIDAAHGVNPKEPQTTLEVPSAEVIEGIVQLWQKHKKHADVSLVIDVSGSMKDEQKLKYAREGARQFVTMMKDEDTLSLLTFNNKLSWARKSVALKNGREKLNEQLDSLLAEGGTALYDAVHEAYQFMSRRAAPDRICAVVVLTDGEDTDSNMKLNELLQRIKLDSERRPIRVFTIGYGSGAVKSVLQSIADATQARFFSGTQKNIEAVFKDISTFF